MNSRLRAHLYGGLLQSGYEVGTKCRMRCMPGFKPHSVARKKCMGDGKWRGEEGECRPLTCPALTTPTNGRIEPFSCITGTQIYLTGSLDKKGDKDAFCYYTKDVTFFSLFVQRTRHRVTIFVSSISLLH
jgi:hypothetical protein